MVVRAAGVLQHLGRPRFRHMPESGIGDDALSFPARHAPTRVWLFSQLRGFGVRRGDVRRGWRARLAPWDVRFWYGHMNALFGMKAKSFRVCS